MTTAHRLCTKMKNIFFIIKTLVLLSVTVFALVCFHEMIVVFSQPFSTTPVFLALCSPLHRLRVNSAQISLKVSILRHCDICQSGWAAMAIVQTAASSCQACQALFTLLCIHLTEDWTVCGLLSNDCTDEKNCVRPPFQWLHWWKELCAASFPMTALMKRTVCSLLSNDCTDEKNCVQPPFQWLHWWKELCAASFPMTALMKRTVCSLLCNDCVDEKNHHLCAVTSFPMTALMKRTVCSLLCNDCVDEKNHHLCAVTSFPMTALMKRTVCSLLCNDCVDEKNHHLCAVTSFPMTALMKRTVCSLLCNDCVGEKNHHLCAVTSFPMTALMKRTVCDRLSNDRTDEKNGLCGISFPLTALMKRTVCNLLPNSDDCTDEKENRVWPPFQWLHWSKGEPCVTSFPMTALIKRRTVCDLLSNDCIDEKKNQLCVTSFPMTALMKRRIDCVRPPFQWPHWWTTKTQVWHCQWCSSWSQKFTDVFIKAQDTSFILHWCVQPKSAATCPRLQKHFSHNSQHGKKILFHSLNHPDKFTLTKQPLTHHLTHHLLSCGGSPRQWVPTEVLPCSHVVVHSGNGYPLRFSLAHM